jgi:chorismate mutase
MKELDLVIEDIYEKVRIEVDAHFVKNQFKTRVLDDLINECLEMTDRLVDKYVREIFMDNILDQEYLMI